MKLFIKIKDYSVKDVEYLTRNGFPVVEDWVDITLLFNGFNVNDLTYIYESLAIPCIITAYKITN